MLLSDDFFILIYLTIFGLSLLDDSFQNKISLIMKMRLTFYIYIFLSLAQLISHDSHYGEFIVFFAVQNTLVSSIFGSIGGKSGGEYDFFGKLRGVIFNEMLAIMQLIFFITYTLRLISFIIIYKYTLQESLFYVTYMTLIDSMLWLLTYPAIRMGLDYLSFVAKK